MKYKVFITDKIPETPLKALQDAGCEIVVNETGYTLTQEELCRSIADADAVLCMLSDTIDDSVLESASKVKIFANYAVGYNNIDIAAATHRGIAVTNTPGVLTHATAELAWALLFATARRIVDADRYTREGKFHGWAPTLYLGQDISGKTLGIIGAGRIGASFARKAAGFDMKILYHNRKRDEAFELETGAEYAELSVLLQQSDFVSLHVPLTTETRYLLGEGELRMMKRNAILINTARGPVVDEKALVRALREGWIWGAGLDVYDNEPVIEPELLKLDNVVLAPHIGSATTHTREKMAEMAIDNILAVLRGEIPSHCVNPGYKEV